MIFQRRKHLNFHQHILWHFFNYFHPRDTSPAEQLWNLQENIIRREYENERHVVTRVLLIKVTVYIKVLIHRVLEVALMETSNILKEKHQSSWRSKAGLKFSRCSRKETSTRDLPRSRDVVHLVSASIGNAYTLAGSRYYLAQFVTYINVTWCIRIRWSIMLFYNRTRVSFAPNN